MASSTCLGQPSNSEQQPVLKGRQPRDVCSEVQSNMLRVRGVRALSMSIGRFQVDPSPLFDAHGETKNVFQRSNLEVTSNKNRLPYLSTLASHNTAWKSNSVSCQPLGAHKSKRYEQFCQNRGDRLTWRALPIGQKPLKTLEWQ